MSSAAVRPSAVDVSAISTALGWLVFYVALFHFRTFDLAPIARDRLVERLVDGMLVLDPQDRVVDLNPAARRLLEPLPTEPIGRHMEETLQSWPELLAAVRGPPLARHHRSHAAQDQTRTPMRWASRRSSTRTVNLRGAWSPGTM